MAVCIRDIPGIGPKLSTNLLRHYEDDASAIAAIRDMQVYEVSGISVNQALKFAMNLFYLEQQVAIGDVLKTPDVNRIYEQILDIIRHFFSTEHARKKLELYFPLPPNKLELINDRLNFAEGALDFVQQSESHPQWGNYIAALGELAPFKDDGTLPKIKSRIIVVDDQRVVEEIKATILSKALDIEFIPPEMLKDAQKIKVALEKYGKDFDAVFLSLQKSIHFPDGPNFFVLESKRGYLVEEMVPEYVFQKFAQNYSQINASCVLIDLLSDLPDTLGRELFLGNLPVRFIPLIKSAMQAIDRNGNLKEAVSKRLDHFRKVAETASGVIAEAETVLNAQIRELVEGSSLTLNGTQLLQLLRSNGIASIQEYLPDEIDLAIKDLIEKSKTDLLKSLVLQSREFPEIDDLILAEFTYPIEFNGEIVEKLISYVSKRARVEEFSLKKKLAVKLSKAIPDIQAILKHLLDLDFFTGLGRFFNYYGLSRPSMLSHPGLILRAAKNLFLQDATGNVTLHEVDSIDYNVGGIPEEPARLNLLTGSNSGGKTTCLLTLAQIAILGQMGFLVPGQVAFYPFDEIYFFEKSSGQLSAGAFEATLLKFVSLATSEKLKLILADELEAITEPTAAARVIGGILSLLLEKPSNYGVFVTHIGDLILDIFRSQLNDLFRVDGIEATGLDENLNLVVNRNPRLNYLAKSTPELIVERLAKLSTGIEKEFFERIRNSF